jgi:hypothetical protein
VAREAQSHSSPKKRYPKSAHVSLSLKNRAPLGKIKSRTYPPQKASGVSPRTFQTQNTTGTHSHAVNGLNNPVQRGPEVTEEYGGIHETTSHNLNHPSENSLHPGKSFPFYTQASFKELSGPRLTLFYRPRYANDWSSLRRSHAGVRWFLS